MANESNKKATTVFRRQVLAVRVASAGVRCNVKVESFVR